LLALANKTEKKDKEQGAQGAHSTNMPNLIGMGARDAVYQTESRGAKVIIKGKGKVRHQSKNAGDPIKKGEKITLELG
jgi:cell division protein FtsI (penicillin-binding protein 3)